MILLSIYDLNQWHFLGFFAVIAAAAVYGIYYIISAFRAFPNWLVRQLLKHRER